MNDDLTSWISEARWFGGKGRRAELRSVTPLPWLTEPGDAGVPAVRFEVAEIGYPSETDAVVEYYQLAVAYRPGPVAELEHAGVGRLSSTEGEPLFGYDAMQDAQALRIILAALIDARKLSGSTGEVVFRLSQGEGLTAEQATAQLSQTAEGMKSGSAVVELARQHDIEMPICEAVVAVLDGKLPVDRLSSLLLARDLKAEGR